MTLNMPRCCVAQRVIVERIVYLQAYFGVTIVKHAIWMEQIAGIGSQVQINTTTSTRSFQVSYMILKVILQYSDFGFKVKFEKSTFLSLIIVILYRGLLRL